MTLSLCTGIGIIHSGGDENASISIADQLPFFKTSDDRGYSGVIGARVLRRISLGKGAEIMGMGEDACLGLLNDLKVAYSYLEEEDIEMEMNYWEIEAFQKLSVVRPGIITDALKELWKIRPELYKMVVINAYLDEKINLTKAAENLALNLERN